MVQDVYLIPPENRSYLVSPSDDMQIPVPIFVKDPAEQLDYTFDWSRMMQTGEYILTTTVTISPIENAGLSIVGTATNDISTVTVPVSLGNLGNTYNINCQILVFNPLVSFDRTFSRSIQVRVANK